MSSGRLARLTSKMQDLLRAAKTTCRQNEIEFLVVYAPAALRVYRDLCIIPDQSPLAGVELDDFPVRLGRWSAAAGIDFLDLTAPLKTAAREGRLVYFPHDEHWSRHGQTVAAEQIAEFLRDAGWLDLEFPPE